MIPQWRRFVPILGSLLLGALAYPLLGNGPHTRPTRDIHQAPWALPSAVALDIAAADSVWEARAPWGAKAVTADDAAEAAAKPAAVGVVVVGNALEALFWAPGEPLLRLREGAELPGGGRVTRITREGVAWIDAEGRARERELFVDPGTSANAAPSDQHRSR